MTERADDEAPTGTDSQDDSIPEGSVPLHRLCDRCRLMFDTWDKSYAWFGKTKGLEPSRGYKDYKFCNFAELMESRQSCHLCEMLHSQINQDDGIPLHEPIVWQIGRPSLWARPSREPPSWSYTLGMSLLLNGRVLSPDCAIISKSANDLCMVDWKIWNRELYFPFAAKHVPRQPTGNLVQVQKWLQDCRTNHDRCNNWFPRLDTKGRRPTRILELSKNGARLRCDPEVIENFEYLALSHMWGKDPSAQLLLTAATLKEFQEAIPTHKLSSIFNEAIRITCDLGFWYLWVDSLCIIQDSASDWTNEANMMSAVYNNAVCTIAFLFPPDVGFCRTRNDPRAATPCIVRDDPGQSGRITITPREEKQSRFLPSNWPLSSRAWVLQEQLLSPRTILYGHRTIMWECGQMFYDELDGSVFGRSMALKTSIQMSRYDLNQTSDSLSVDAWGIHRTFSDWARLIREYRRRDLSHSSDRIIAMVGIAQAFQSEYGFTYLAGMWKEHLPSALLWYIDTLPARNMAELFLTREPRFGSVPTWSWFAGSIYEHCNLVISEERSQPCFMAKFLHFKWSREPVNDAPPTTYYNFEGLRITLELATHITTILLEEPYGEHGRHRLSCDSLEGDLASCLGLDRSCVTASYHCDDLETLYQHPSKVRIALIAEEGIAGRFLRNLQGLALAPGVESDTWERIGYWKACIHLGKETWEMESIFLRLDGVKIETLTLV